MFTKEVEERRLEILRSNVAYSYMRYKPKGSQSFYEQKELNGYVDAYINLCHTPVMLGGNLL